MTFVVVVSLQSEGRGKENEWKGRCGLAVPERDGGRVASCVFWQNGAARKRNPMLAAAHFFAASTGPTTLADGVVLLKTAHMQKLHQGIVLSVNFRTVNSWNCNPALLLPHISLSLSETKPQCHDLVVVRFMFHFFSRQTLSTGPRRHYYTAGKKPFSQR